jgi:very-short-patch-repair endonuclease
MFEITTEFLKSRWLIQGVKRLTYNPKLKERARELRKNATKPEQKVWNDFLKWLTIETPPPMRGEETTERLRVYRQRPIDNFIVDFYVPKYKLVIEIDWDSHCEGWMKEYDDERTDILEWYWLHVIRFTNTEVMNDFEWVYEEIIKIF